MHLTIKINIIATQIIMQLIQLLVMSQIATATKMIQNISIRSIGMNNPLINVILKRS